MIDLARHDAIRACMIARYAAALGCLGLAFDVATTTGFAAAEPVSLVAIAVCGALFVVLWLVRDRPSQLVGIAAFLALNLAIIASLWVSQQRLAESHEHWVPFRPNHLGALAVALLAPSRPWVGGVTIAGFTLAPVVQFALFDPAIRERLPYGDPWATLAFGGFAAGLLLFRLRTSRIEREIVAVQARMVALERFARTMLALRDLTNTPLQTLTLSVELLRDDEPATKVIANRIERAVTRLQEIERLASAYDQDLEWPRGAETLESEQILRNPWN